MKSLYHILEVDPSADAGMVKRAYFVMAKKYHPDSGDQAEVKKFYEVSEAYQILGDPEKRKVYDLSLSTGKIDKELIEKEPPEMSVEYSRSTHGQDAEFRQKEIYRYRQQLLLQAVFKVVVTVIVAALIGNTLAVLLDGSILLGVVAGTVFGLFWSVRSHFELSSFIHNSFHLRLALWGGRALMVMSVFYFAGLFLYHLFWSN